MNGRWHRFAFVAWIGSGSMADLTIPAKLACARPSASRTARGGSRLLLSENRERERDQRTNRITTMTTAITRATIAIVRVSMARPYSVSLAVSPDPASGTPLSLTHGWGRPERLLAGCSLWTTDESQGPGTRFQLDFG